jgi:hypothetical protein
VQQGIPGDSSNDEWDEHIEAKYGRQWQNTLWPKEHELDGGLDMVDMVHHIFHHYDEDISFKGFNFRQ